MHMAALNYNVISSMEDVAVRSDEEVGLARNVRTISGVTQHLLRVVRGANVIPLVLPACSATEITEHVFAFQDQEVICVTNALEATQDPGRFANRAENVSINGIISYKA